MQGFFRLGEWLGESPRNTIALSGDYQRSRTAAVAAALAIGEKQVHVVGIAADLFS